MQVPFKKPIVRAIKKTQECLSTPDIKGLQIASTKSEVLRIEKDMAMLEAIAQNNILATKADNTTSQGGEDGILATIMHTIGMDKAPNWVVEFGACDGKRDSNSWQWIHEKGFSGVLIEGEPGWFEGLKNTNADRDDVHCFSCLVDWEGENTLDKILGRTPIPKDFALLCIDIDGNDYHVWKAFTQYSPHVVCIEFHRLIHPTIHFVQPKDPSLNWPSSLASLTELAKSKGYELVCVVNWNAIFVKAEHFSKFNIKDNRPEMMYHSIEEMRIFQGYDGSLKLCGNNNHYWKYQHPPGGEVTNVKISQRDIQVLPDGLRQFHPRHSYTCNTLEKVKGTLDQASHPANVLLAHRQNVVSECGEDGILSHLFKQLKIESGYAVEVGANNGKYYSNCYNLFVNKGWRGLAIEKDASLFDQLQDCFKDQPQVRPLHALIEATGEQSLNQLLEANNTPKQFDLLSIDVEGDDYHLWSSLKGYEPAVVVLDFNPSIANDIFYVQEYQATSPFGASLRACASLAHNKGYKLIAATDWNAIFLRNDLISATLAPTYTLLDDMYTPPFEMRMTQTLDGRLHLLKGNVLARQDYTIDPEEFQVLPPKMLGRDNSPEAFGIAPSVFYNQ